MKHHKPGTEDRKETETGPNKSNINNEKEKWHRGHEMATDPNVEMTFFASSTLLGVKLNTVETESRREN